MKCYICFHIFEQLIWLIFAKIPEIDFNNHKIYDIPKYTRKDISIFRILCVQLPQGKISLIVGFSPL